MRPTRTITALAGLGIALALVAACAAGSRQHNTSSSAPGAANTSSDLNSASSNSTASTIAAVSVTITGGLDTVAGDNGRPIVLVAGLLGVPSAVFRTAFSGVTPADPAVGPTSDEAQRNKAALLSVLGAYRITNDQLDAASNTYRYNGSAGQMWPHTSATATAVVTNGVITGVKVTNGGSGYTSAPTVTLSNGMTAIATLSYTKTAATNGSISTITLS